VAAALARPFVRTRFREFAPDWFKTITPFIALRFVFGDAHPDKCADQAPDRTADAEPRQACHRAGCDERPKARNRKRANTGQNAERAAENSAGSDTSRCAFRSLGVFLMSEVFRASRIGKQDRNVTARKPCLHQMIHSLFRMHRRGVNSEYVVGWHC
jgi:hypothetical protein